MILCAMLFRVVVSDCKRRYGMATSYKKLWKLLIDKDMSKNDLVKATGMARNTMTKLNRDEQVMLLVLDKICKVLDCNYGDIIDYIPDIESEKKIQKRKGMQ